jgi:hypothetical protein
MLNRQTEQIIQLTIVVIALVTMLAYTFVHTGGLLARYVRPGLVGYVAAFGIELLVAGISLRLATLKQAQTSSRSLLFILAFALTVSALANIAEGYHTMYLKPLTWSNIGDIDLIQALIGIAATGLISVMVFAASEVIGSDIDVIVKRVEKERKKAERNEQPELPRPEQPEHGQTGDEQQAEQKDGSFQETIYRILNTGERPGPTELARRTGASKATASKWIKTWESEQLNGNGKH